MIFLKKSMLILMTAGLVAVSSATAAPTQKVADGKSAAQKALPAALAKAARQLKVNANDVVISIVELDSTNKPVLSWNETRKVRPASVAKLVTTLAALETLGSNYHWFTGIYTKEEPSSDGKLNGGLFVRGGGDPSFVVEDFELQVERLAQTGIKHIEGDVVLDRSYFNVAEVDPSAFDGKGSRPYNMQPDAALFNYRNLSLEFVPDKGAGIAHVVMVPKLAGVVAPETIALSKGACGDVKNKLGFKLVNEKDGTKRVVFRGSLPANCGPKIFNTIAFEADDYFERLFRELWERDGRTWKGKVVAGPIPADATRRLVRVSQPLGEVIELTNKWSNNLMARHIFLTLGAERVRAEFLKEKRAQKKKGGDDDDGLQFARGATIEDARAALADWLKTKGISSEEIWLDNGSGLSRDSFVTASAMTRMLSAGWSGPYMPEYLSSMPITGKDGTMAKRHVAEGEGRIKTGYLTDVRSIGGYIHAKNGRRYAVYASVHGKSVVGGIPFLNRVIDWVYRQK